MNLGQEITAKIRSAIKAKLTELDAYVDDELPDYILVMVANRKSKESMNKDLNLFLGAHTQPFTNWLHEILDRLQSIPTENSKEPDQNRVKEKEKEKIKEKEVKEKEKTKEKEVKEKERVKQKHDDRKRNESRSSRKSSEASRHRDSEKKQTTSSKSSSKPQEKPMIDFLKLREENDEFTEEMERKQRDKLKSSYKEPEHPPAKPERRPIIRSRVGAVLDKTDQADSDDEARNESIVHSVVKVTERKSSVAPSLRPTGSLLQRAMMEAHASVLQRNTSKQQLTVTPEPESNAFAQMDAGAFMEMDRGLPSVASDSESRSSQQASATTSPKFIVTLKGASVDVQSRLGPPSSEKTSPSVPVVEWDDVLVVNPPTPTGSDDISSELDLVVEDVRRPIHERLGRRLGEEEESVAASEDVDMEEVVSVKKATKRGLVVNINEEEDEKWEEETTVKRAKQEEETTEGEESIPSVLERCKFWPSCRNGGQCPYMHPSEPCKTFPRCRFGTSCLYIHPYCRFNTSCSREKCPYTHSGKKNPLAMTIAKALTVPSPAIAAALPLAPTPGPGSVMSKCRYFPRCTNPSCVYVHPHVPCRFGLRCANKDNCMYTHPSAPDKQQFKWTAPGLSPANKTSCSDKPTSEQTANGESKPVAV